MCEIEKFKVWRRITRREFSSSDKEGSGGGFEHVRMAAGDNNDLSARNMTICGFAVARADFGLAPAEAIAVEDAKINKDARESCE